MRGTSCGNGSGSKYAGAAMLIASPWCFAVEQNAWKVALPSSTVWNSRRVRFRMTPILIQVERELACGAQTWTQQLNLTPGSRSSSLPTVPRLRAWPGSLCRVRTSGVVWGTWARRISLISAATTLVSSYLLIVMPSPRSTSFRPYVVVRGRQLVGRSFLRPVSAVCDVVGTGLDLLNGWNEVHQSVDVGWVDAENSWAAAVCG